MVFKEKNKNMVFKKIIYKNMVFNFEKIWYLILVFNCAVNYSFLLIILKFDQLIVNNHYRLLIIWQISFSGFREIKIFKLNFFMKSERKQIYIKFL